MHDAYQTVIGTDMLNVTDFRFCSLKRQQLSF